MASASLSSLGGPFFIVGLCENHAAPAPRRHQPPNLWTCPSAFLGTPSLGGSLPFWFVPSLPSEPSGNSSLSIGPKQSQLFPEITSMPPFFFAALTTVVRCCRHLSAVLCNACHLLRVKSLRAGQCLSCSPWCLQEMAPCLARCRD